MKKSIIIIAIISFLYAVSCTDDNSIAPIENKNQYSSMIIYDNFVEELNLGSLQKPIEIKFRSQFEKFDMSEFFAKLNLPRSSRIGINQCINERNLKAEAIMNNMFAEINIAVEKANYVREVIIKNYNTELISPSEAVSAINSLNNGILVSLGERGLKNKYFNKLYQEQIVMVNRISTYLNDNDKQLWNEFTNKHHKVFFGLPL